jgi:hypothetical protein
MHSSNQCLNFKVESKFINEAALVLIRPRCVGQVAIVCEWFRGFFQLQHKFWHKYGCWYMLYEVAVLP